MTTEKSIYTQLCATADVPIFMQNWWLDAVCTEGWSVVLSYDEKGDIEAALTFAKRQKWGLKTLSEPVLTPFCGVWFRQKTFKRQHEAIFYQKKHLQKLIDALPFAHRYSFRLHVSLKDWQPFYWSGWQQETRYTYRLNIENIATVFQDFNDNTKRNIRKSAQCFTIESSDDFDKFLEINDLTYQRQGIKNPIPLETWHAVEQVLKAKNARSLFFAKNTEGSVGHSKPKTQNSKLENTEGSVAHSKLKTQNSKRDIEAAVYVIFDDKNRTAYYLAGGSTDSGRSKGAMHGLLGQAIQEAAARGCTTFDFEGSMLQGVEPFFRGFGGELTPYFRVFKYANRFLSYFLK